MSLIFATDPQIGSLSTTSPAALRAKDTADQVKNATLVGGSTTDALTNIKNVSNKVGPIALETALWWKRTGDNTYLQPLITFILDTPKPPDTNQALNEWRGLGGVFAAVQLLRRAGKWNDLATLPNHGGITWTDFLLTYGGKTYAERQIDTSTAQRWRWLAPAAGTSTSQGPTQKSPSNWGAVARACKLALDALLLDMGVAGAQAEVDADVAVYKQFFGDNPSALPNFYTSGSYRSSWDNWYSGTAVNGASTYIPAGIGKYDAANPGLDGVIINDIDRGSTDYSATTAFYGATAGGLTYSQEAADYVWFEAAYLVNAGIDVRLIGEHGNALVRMNDRLARHRIPGEQSVFDANEAANAVYRGGRFIASQLSGVDYERASALTPSSGPVGTSRALPHGDWLAPADGSSTWATPAVTPSVAVDDRWDGTQLVRQRVDVWDGATLVQQMATPG